MYKCDLIIIFQKLILKWLDLGMFKRFIKWNSNISIQKPWWRLEMFMLLNIERHMFPMQTEVELYIECK